MMKKYAILIGIIIGTFLLILATFHYPGGTYENVNSFYTGTVAWPDNEWLMPIPQSELELNAENGWIQNNGY